MYTKIYSKYQYNKKCRDVYLKWGSNPKQKSYIEFKLCAFMGSNRQDEIVLELLLSLLREIERKCIDNEIPKPRRY